MWNVWNVIFEDVVGFDSAVQNACQGKRRDRERPRTSENQAKQSFNFCHFLENCQFANQFEEKAKHISSNLLSPFGAQNKDIGAALLKLLTRVRLDL